jgi:predicted transcriptional regulator
MDRRAKARRFSFAGSGGAFTRPRWDMVEIFEQDGEPMALMSRRPGS